jgi:hypothetical protein
VAKPHAISHAFQAVPVVAVLLAIAPFFYVDRNSERSNSSIIAQDNKPPALKMGDRDGLPSIHDRRLPRIA